MLMVSSSLSKRLLRRRSPQKSFERAVRPGEHAARRSTQVLALFCVLALPVGAEQGIAGSHRSQSGDFPLIGDAGLPRMFEAASGLGSGPKTMAQGDSADVPETAPPPPKPLKSPGRALLFSAMLPGMGEFYAGARKRAVLFFGLEAAAWGLYFSWSGKGRDIEEDFRAVADEQWDVLRYVDWRGSTISRNSSITHALPCSTFVVGGEGISGCPETEKQQYYELIGKYDQFVSGWKDVRDRLGNEVLPTEIDSAENFVSEQRFAYEDQRNDSNRFLKRATNVAGLILVNHVISAVDAARAARLTARGADQTALQRRTRFAFVRGGPSGRTPMILAWKPLF